MKKLLLLVTGFVLLFSLLYLLAGAFGLTDPAWIDRQLRLLGERPGGQVWLTLTVAGLLAGDLVLPVPSSVLMTLAGYLLGLLPGALAAFAGAWCSALIGFGLCRRYGQRAFTRLVGEREAQRFATLLETYGAWAILLSRAVPLLTETTSCLAGLSPMPFSRFAALSAAGTLPICLVYAWAGAAGATHGIGWALLVAFVVPGLGFGLLRLRTRRRTAANA